MTNFTPENIFQPNTRSGAHKELYANEVSFTSTERHKALSNFAVMVCKWRRFEIRLNSLHIQDETNMEVVFVHMTSPKLLKDFLKTFILSTTNTVCRYRLLALSVQHRSNFTFSQYSDCATD